MCAGVVAAIADYNTGIVGVAPDARLIDISNSLDATPLSRIKRADAIMKAWKMGADVISNSWSSTTEYTQINEAVASAIRNGRNGKGCVVVFASGNDYNSVVSYPSSIADVVSVGAINSNNMRADFSNYGTALDLVAPGASIFLTNSSGGYSYGNGTSFACPYVAGIAALVISASPELTQSEVQSILKSTCMKLPSYSFSDSSIHPHGSWNEEVGYGMVDAYAAVKKAREVKPVMRTLQFSLANGDDYPHTIECKLYDESGKLVWNYEKRVEAHSILGDEISIYPGIYTMEADTYDAYQPYSLTFELINEGLFVIDFTGHTWDSSSGYDEFVLGGW